VCSGLKAEMEFGEVTICVRVLGALEEVTDANPVPNFGALETYSDTAQIGELSP
jgi:hypothetical protein